MDILRGKNPEKRISFGGRLQYHLCLGGAARAGKRKPGAAQGRIMDILSNYQGMRKCTLILVFDAYKVEGTKKRCSNTTIFTWYTQGKRRPQTSTLKTVHKIGREHPVSVATSDGLEQMIILGQGRQSDFCKRTLGRD